MEKIWDVSVKDWASAETAGLEEKFENELIIVEVRGDRPEQMMHSIFPARLKALSILITLRGELTIGVDYVNYVVKKNMVMEIFSQHLIESLTISPDYRGFQVVVSLDIVNSVLSQVRIPHLDQTDIKRFRPVRRMEEKDIRKLVEILNRVRKYITEAENHYQRNLVYCELAVFLLEFGNIGLGKKSEEVTYEPSHKEEIISRFVQLLVKHCRQQSEVSFYARELCITPEYLSRVMKSVSGKSVHVWIKEARITEAKLLLRRPDSTVQQVSEELYFSDQSCFGKFFKKHTGQSPLEYKRTCIYSVNAPVFATAE